MARKLVTPRAQLGRLEFGDDDWETLTYGPTMPPTPRELSRLRELYHRNVDALTFCRRNWGFFAFVVGAHPLEGESAAAAMERLCPQLMDAEDRANLARERAQDAWFEDRMTGLQAAGLEANPVDLRAWASYQERHARRAAWQAHREVH